MEACITASACLGSKSLEIGPTLAPRTFESIRRRLVLDHCKWDPQVGDVSTLAPFPLLMSRGTWGVLARDAEQLAAETIRAESWLMERPDLQRRIGVPWRLRRLLNRATRGGAAPSALRVMRFDFHHTVEGWRVSEVNSDVPGGFCEGSSFTRMVAVHYPGYEPAGDPAGVFACALAPNVSGPIALLRAAGFMEDQQVVSYLAGCLEQLGCGAIVADPQQLRWQEGFAHLGGRHLGAIVRFYQAEWLANLPRCCGWWNLIAGGRTPVTNAAAALLSESKRFPLAWDAMPFDLPAWRRLLPETRDPRDAPWQNDDRWLIKSAYCNTGDSVAIRSLADPMQWRKAARSARWHPRQWVAQRRFDTIALSSPIGMVYPCVGVYVIDGRAAGVYARISHTSIIDYAATDIALLLKPEQTDE